MEFVELYNLREDKQHIEKVQHATLNTKEYGLQIENGLLFGSEEWFQAIDSGKIKLIEVRGTISEIRMAGDHNDSREIEVTSDFNGEKTTWGTKGKLKYFQIGKKIEITYVLQKFKKPNLVLGTYSRCILTYKVEA